MDLVPPEILLQVFEYVGGPVPSETRLHDQPSLDLLSTKLENPRPSLKAASLVSRSWRSLVLHRLFRHVLWKPDVRSLSAFTLNPIPLLRFLTENCLAHSVITFTLVIDFHDPAAVDYQVSSRIRTTDLEWLWNQLFSIIDPLRFTILARPTTLAALLSCMLYLNDAWSFDISYHILSFARTTRQMITGRDGPSSSTSADTKPTTTPTVSSVSHRRASSSTFRSRAIAISPLFIVRPWTSILLNEGSSTKVYRVYEFYLRRPPSILGALLGCEEYPNNVPLIPQSVVDFNYIAIFPLASHFEILLEHLPRIGRLFVQLTPKSEGSILENVDEMRHIDPSDLWLERDTSYTALMRELLVFNTPSTNWNKLRVFESGDAADREAWDIIVKCFERSETTEWKIERPGVFTKHTDDQSSGWSYEVNGHVGQIPSGPNSN
ncbi:hypothetical protein F5Y09DRAFT_20369 [Xylaria sp. FL1042]|nr:hypothetical protein F5Y09DRAFT_20369 [Xylaria sp. FL1042]